MRLLINDYAGYSFVVPLSREIASRGYEVRHVFAGYNTTPMGEVTEKSTDPTGFSIKPLYTEKPLQKYRFFSRWKQEREYGRLLATEINHYKPDIVISANNPLDAQKIILEKCVNDDIKFVFWLQDVISIATEKIINKKYPVLGTLVGNYYKKLERNLLRRSDSIITITQDFFPIIKRWGVESNKVHILPNWSSVDEITPQPKENSWSVFHGLSDKFCFMYTGTLGMKHNPALLLRLSQYFRSNSLVRVVVISEGPGADWLDEKKREEQVENLIVMKYQPYEQLQFVLGTADVLVAVLEPEAGVYSVPSKVLTYLCAQRAILMAVPSENMAAKVVCDNHAGLVVDPNDKMGFFRLANNLLSDSNLRLRLASNGRRYAESTFDIGKVADRFEQILLS